MNYICVEQIVHVCYHLLKFKTRICHLTMILFFNIWFVVFGEIKLQAHRDDVFIFFSAFLLLKVVHFSVNDIGYLVFFNTV